MEKRKKKDLEVKRLENGDMSKLVMEANKFVCLHLILTTPLWEQGLLSGLLLSDKDYYFSIVE